MKKFMLTMLFSGYCLMLSAQQLSQRINIVFDQMPLEEALFKLMDQEQVPLLFRNDIIPKKTIHNTFDDYPLDGILKHLFRDTRLMFRVVGQDILIEEYTNSTLPERIISGQIIDESTGESIIGATIHIPDLSSGTYTNEYGQFSLTLPEGEWDLFFSHIGFSNQSIKVNLRRDTSLDISLKYSILLDQVVLWDTGGTPNRTPIDWDLEKIDLAATKFLPRLGGEADIIRSLHLLPGVQSGPDGIGGIFIRGGNAGHNLIMVDGVPVYNVNHAAGLLSVFNPSVIKTAKLLKGAYPARYEGRLSSVLDIRTRDGNYNQFEGQADIGLLSGRLSLEGPLSVANDKASFLLAGRWSYINQFLEPRIRSYKRRLNEDGSSNYDFYDFNAKFNYQFSKRSKLFLSYYKGSDDFDNFGTKIDEFTILDPQTNSLVPFRLSQDYDERVNWGNEVLALRWNAELHPKLFANTTLTYSSLALTFGFENTDSLSLNFPRQLLDFSLDAGWYNSSIRDYAVKVDFDWHPALNHYVRFGVKGGKIRFQPGVLQFNAVTLENVGQGQQSNRPIHSNELTFYAENSQQLHPNLSLNYGVHVANNFVDRTSYISFQPRFSLYWQASNTIGINTSIRKTNQFLHFLSTSAIGLPTDLWVPSTGDIHPEQAWQYTFGTNIKLNPSWRFKAEAYYRKMDQILAYSEGVTFIDDWEKNVSSGQGEAYGIDFSLEKNLGNTTGWISYSFAFANRQFDNINASRTFPFTYDRRHDIKLAMIHQFSDRFSISANMLFGTGLAFSLPRQSFTIQLPGQNSIPISILDFGEKNSFRLPAYHRLDFGANYQYSLWGLRHHLYVGVTNAYDRDNPLYYRLRSDLAIRNSQITQFKQFVGVKLLPILPSFNYSIKF